MHSKLFILIFVKFKKKCKIENKLKELLQRILQEIMKQKNTWNIRRLVNEKDRPSDPAYYIEDCRIFNLNYTVITIISCPYYGSINISPNSYFLWVTSAIQNIDFLVSATHSKISLSQKRLSLTDQVEAVGQKAVHKFIIEPNQRRKSMEMMINFSASDSEERTSGESSSDELSGGANGKNWYFVTKIVLTY